MAYDATTPERKQVQYDVLTYKLDSNTNDKLVYRDSATGNKGLNPQYFAGNDTKLVNILNKFYLSISNMKETVDKLSTKINPVILDTDLLDNAAILEDMRQATGKQTLVESILALAKGEVGGLAYLNPSEAEDGFVVTFDKDQNKFVLKPAAGEIDQNLILFENEIAKNDYLNASICKKGQIGHLNGRHYKVVGTGANHDVATKLFNFTVEENKTLSLSTSVVDADNLSLVESDTKFTVVLDDVQPNIDYTLIMDEELQVAITESRLDDSTKSMGSNILATDGKITWSTVDPTIKRVYFVVSPAANDGLNVVNAKVALVESLEILAWKDMHDFSRQDATTVEVGGLQKGTILNGTIESVLDEILYPVLAPTMELKAADGQQVVFEKGTSAQNIKMLLTFDRTSTTADIKGYKLYRNDTLVDEQNISPDLNSVNIIYYNDNQKTDIALTVPFDIDSKFKVELVYGDDKVVSKEMDVVFVNPIFVGSCGLITDSTIASELITNDNKLLLAKFESVEHEFTHVDKMEMIAYPSSLGTLKEIKDKNFDLTDTFNSKLITVNSIEYIVYYSEFKHCVNNFKVTFSL